MVRFVEPGDAEAMAEALVELATDPDRRATLATNAQRFSRQFQWADQAAAYEALVHRLGGEKPATMETT
jgi:glycosyltransferase involved in cell wall biosynthesis